MRELGREKMIYIYIYERPYLGDIGDIGDIHVEGVTGYGGTWM